MRAHDGVRFAVVEGAFLPDALEAVEKLVVVSWQDLYLKLTLQNDGGACEKAAVPAPDTDFVIIPHLAQAADSVLVSRLIEGDLEEWRGITLVTAEWIKLSMQMVQSFQELYDEYKVSALSPRRSQSKADVCKDRRDEGRARGG